MNYSEDQLRELELWPYVALARRASGQALTTTQTHKPDSAAQAVRRPVVASDLAPSESTARPAPSMRTPRPLAKVAPEKVASVPVVRVDASALDWEGLQAAVSTCTACGLCKQRKQAVLGVGAQNAPWLFVGEGPGAEEDEMGEPFVGPAGKLLDAMLAAAGLARGRDVYIANVVKCRPPGNRTPTAEEALACGSYLDRQIDLLKPALIVALGKTAVARLTGEDASMASMRGQLHRYRSIPVVATYHPAYLLRSLPEKLKAWEDLVFAKRAFAATDRQAESAAK